jgi:chitin disaccharide deacetylase
LAASPIRLIVSADDVGLAPGITAGALRAAEQGLVTSLSVLTAVDRWHETRAQLAAHPGLDVGVHLTLCEGRPVLPSSEIPALITPDGRFPRALRGVAARAWAPGRRRADWLEQVRREWSAQIGRAVDAGLSPSHVDGHKHVHLMPGLFDVAAGLCRELGLPGMRLPRRVGLRRRPLVGAALSWRSARARRAAGIAGLVTPDRLVGVDVAGALDLDRLLALLDRLPPGTSELCAHPGLPGPSIAQELARQGLDWGRRYAFGGELEALCAPEALELVTRRGIELVGYRELASLPA